MLSTADTQAKKPQRFAVKALAMAMTLSMLMPLPAQADDLEIYQPSQTGGRKTLILMLDSSGNMSSNYNGTNKMKSVVDGMTTFLNSSDPKLNAIVVGLGHFSAFNDPYDGSGNHASILVPAAPLGAVGSAQRTTMLNKLNKLPGEPDYFKGNGNSPLLNGYVEAAAYLMGTRTAIPSACTTTAGQTTCTLKDDTTSTDESGLNSSVDAAKNVTDLTNINYKSPLPLPAERQACDGQGIYFLAGGGLNATSNSVAVQMMSKALQKTDRTENTYCPIDYAGLTNMQPISNMPWNCMAKFARTLYDPATNPSGVKIKSAFVGYGADFVGLSSDSALNACHFGSNLKGQLCSTDVVDAVGTEKKKQNPPEGYGNGGFYIATKKEDVTASILNFIENLGNDTVAPLVTGAATIPIDSLDPNGFQTNGYLRMLEPNPAKPTYLLWRGNLKRYNLSGGAMVSKGSTSPVLDSSGKLVLNTTDLWNTKTEGGDGGKIEEGGAYSNPNVPMPTTATPSTIRSLFTDVGVANGAALQEVPGSATPSTSIPTYFDVATGTSPFKDMTLDQKKTLINYLGYDLPLGDGIAIPTPLTTPATPFLSMGGSIHAQPIQLSYTSTLNTNGSLSTLKDANGNVIGRTESVLYGSMEGALHMVDAKTGVEQMAFVPKEILVDPVQSKALRRGEIDGSSTFTPAQGVDGPWVADAVYKTSKTSSSLSATRMHVYGGLRMGGSSYYGLDLSTKTGNKVSPRLLFRIGPDVTGFSEMGQSWSKPVLANVRYGGAITRVMIVGGGYDINYESSSYVPNSAATPGPAKGNTVYMVNALTGALIWKATNTNLIHSVTSRVSAIDSDSDGFIDNVYFADLGGQVFRADFNNKFDTSTSNFGMRLTRLANLGTTSTGTAIINGTNPRIYEAPSVTIHDQGTTTFALISVASGNRSSPLDVLSVAEGGKGLNITTSPVPTPAPPLPVNNVYGIIDRDVVSPNLLNAAYTPVTQNKTLSDLQKDPQTIALAVGNTFIRTSSADLTTKKDGWYRSLSSTNDCPFADPPIACATANTAREITSGVGAIRYAGGLKAYEEQIALTGKLYVPVYDPQGTGVLADPCQPRVVGETDLQTYCLPYGVCLDSSGNRNNTAEAASGAKLPNTSNDPGKKTLIGPGIRGISLGDNGPSATGGDCKGFTIVGNTGGKGAWNCKRKLVQTLWYEKKPNRSKVQ